jgi:hypothetical protein
MPEQPVTYLNRVTITITDEIYNTVKQAAEQRVTSMEALIIEAIEEKLGLKSSPRLPVEVLRQYLVQEMKLNATGGLNAECVLTGSQDKTMFVIVDIAIIQGKRYVDSGLIAQIVKDFIVIECDQNDKPLVDALLQAGVPRSQIILAYTGEPVPETEV